MQLVDYTHPDRVPPLHLSHDRRSPQFYVRLDDLPADHPYFSAEWALFRHPEWLDGGTAWVHSQAILKDLTGYAQDHGLLETQIRPVVGSDDPAYDEALAQSLRILGFSPLVAELVQRDASATAHSPVEA
jgi:hypothetical protein